jgi:hypothetical protein
MRLEMNDYNDIVFEWVTYNQFSEINKIDKGNFATVYSAIWKDGPLHYISQNDKYIRDSNKEVVLKYLHNSQNSTEYLINEVCNFDKFNQTSLI